MRGKVRELRVKDKTKMADPGNEYRQEIAHRTHEVPDEAAAYAILPLVRSHSSSPARRYASEARRASAVMVLVGWPRPLVTKLSHRRETGSALVGAVVGVDHRRLRIFAHAAGARRCTAKLDSSIG